MGLVGDELSQPSELWIWGSGSLRSSIFCSGNRTRVWLENSQRTVVWLEGTMNMEKEPKPQGESNKREDMK